MNMCCRLFSILTIIFFSLNLSYCQDILNDSLRIDGLYENFVSFRTNNPDTKGKITFIKNNKGKVIQFSINGDSIRAQKIINKYWGFCKDSILYINVMNKWASVDSYSSPLFPYYPVYTGSVYSYSLIQTNTSSSNMTAMSSSFGLIGGLIAAGFNELSQKKSIEDFNTVLTVNNRSGKISVADRTQLKYLIKNENLSNRFKKEKNQDASVILNYIKEYNSINKNDIEFDINDFQPLITIVRKSRKESELPITISANGVILGILSSGSFIKQHIQIKDMVRLVAVIDGTNASSEIVIKPDLKERFYFVISNDRKNSSNIDFKHSDYTRTKYLIESLK